MINIDRKYVFDIIKLKNKNGSKSLDKWDAKLLDISSFLLWFGWTVQWPLREGLQKQELGQSGAWVRDHMLRQTNANIQLIE